MDQVGIGALRWLVLLAAVLFCWTGEFSPVKAQDIKYFYCYAVDAADGRVLISDGHVVESVSLRAAYPEQFRTYLAAKGFASSKSQAYCVMRATMQEMERGVADLPAQCRECLGAQRFEKVVWPRLGKSAGMLLAGKLRPPEMVEDVSGRAPGGGPLPATLPPQRQTQGLSMLVRLDKPDVIHNGNQSDSMALMRLRADLRGGRWTVLLQDDRCVGWGAVSYASDGASFVYFVERGASDEGMAARTALADASAYAAKNAGWQAHMLESYDNQYQVDVSAEIEKGRGAIDVAKKLLATQLIDYCAPKPEYTTVGVRG